MLFVFARRYPLKLQIYCQLYQLTMRYIYYGWQRLHGS